MKQFLIAVDLQRDFVDGALGTPEAAAMLPAAVEKLRGFQGEIFVTLDTHGPAYLETAEGKKLPVPHCIRGTDGWQLHPAVASALAGRKYTVVEKPTFGSTELPRLVAEAAGGESFTLELIGLCTDICVVSNALILKAYFPEMPISVDAACCAGVSPETHRAALETMRCCQIDVINAGQGR